MKLKSEVSNFVLKKGSSQYKKYYSKQGIYLNSSFFISRRYKRCLSHNIRSLDRNSNPWRPRCVAIVVTTLFLVSVNILSRVWVNIDGFWIGHCIYWPLTDLNYKQLKQLHWFTYSKDHCNCSTHKVFYVFTSRFLATDPNNVICLRLIG
jgi:hypothetical protein